LFYKPLEEELKNSTTIFLTPTGLAHQINFKALPLTGNQTWCDRYSIKLLGSTTAIVDYKTAALSGNKNLEIVLYGGIDYNKNDSQNNEAQNSNPFNELATRSGITEFGYLGGTFSEVQNIAAQAKKNHFVSIIKTDKEATEESIKQLDGKKTPFVLHLATHGFFFENAEKELPKEEPSLEEKSNVYKMSDDPMLRSGLLFAGANKFWRKQNDEKIDDGILTAKEISNLDLSACQLVVLSACETGLGQINGSEGVFGLQRAFKMAGVKNIIMSLWKVPDVQTSELFEIFYTECFKGNSIQEAFQTAQNQMKSKYDPYFWAGFVLLE
jgi:CHAT domain-containing protein